tara:strand:- start:1097 stop:2167 length:1071 start_codon:yes stop_codon:yes gene_type:complete
MLLLATSGLGLAKAAAKSDGAFAKWIVFQGTHPEWNSQFGFLGLSVWDLIQPAFMFIVGVSMPFSYRKREALGQNYSQRLRHAWVRALMLVLLGVFLQSWRRPETNWVFTNVLSQIGLGYGFLFFLVGKSYRTQITAGAAILIGYFVLMLTLPSGLENWKAHFENGPSFPQQVDLWLLNLFPREKPFTGHPYATLNFVPSIVTMLMGLMCGQLLRDASVPASSKLKRLLIAAAALLVTGAICGVTICPIVKKLWTPSWTLYSGGYAIALLALFYWVIDIKGWNKWVFPFVVVGFNPLTMYLLGIMAKRATSDTLHRHLPATLFSGTAGPVVEACLIALIFWMILWWMYRNRIFIRL